MFSDSGSDDEADPHCRLALPSRFLGAKERAENGEEDRFDTDSEGGLDGHLEDFEERELHSESEIQSVIEQDIQQAGSVAMYNKLSKMADEIMKTASGIPRVDFLMVYGCHIHVISCHMTI